MNDAIHICYGGNRRVYPGLLLSALSIIKHTDRPVRLYVLSMDLHEQDACYVPFSEQQMEVLNTVLREKNPESGATLPPLFGGRKEQQELLHSLHNAPPVYERIAGPAR